jgi:hypothetical protein
MVVSAGIALLALFGLLGWLTRAAVGTTALWFIPVWLLCAGINMWIGVTRAGYTLAQEFPIFVVVFAVPATVAALLHRRLSR